MWRASRISKHVGVTGAAAAVFGFSYQQQHQPVLTKAATSQQAADCAKAAESIKNIRANGPFKVVAGFDGFIDNIIDVVEKRASPTEYTTFPGIGELGKFISSSAGESCNIELVVKKSKIGGNGPIMCNASCGYGIHLTYIGLLGEVGQLNPVFSPMVNVAKEIITLGEPSVTDALEFKDGKIMMGKHASLKLVTWDTLKSVVGVPRLRELLDASQAFVCINWTMCLGLTGIWEGLIEEVLPHLKKRPIFFVDIADPAKRSREDLKKMLVTLGRLQKYVDVVFSINMSETRQCLEVLGEEWVGHKEDMDAAKRGAAILQKKTGISIVQVHLKGAAAAASATEAVAVPGYYTLNPNITTGGGDHFNGGFLSALLNGCSLSDSLRVGGATSGYYVRNMESPTVEKTVNFLRNLPDIDDMPKD
jgi:hypothetical protein